MRSFFPQPEAHCESLCDEGQRLVLSQPGRCAFINQLGLRLRRRRREDVSARPARFPHKQCSTRKVQLLPCVEFAGKHRKLLNTEDRKVCEWAARPSQSQPVIRVSIEQTTEELHQAQETTEGRSRAQTTEIRQG